MTVLTGLLTEVLVIADDHAGRGRVIICSISVLKRKGPSDLLFNFRWSTFIISFHRFWKTKWCGKNANDIASLRLIRLICYLKKPNKWRSRLTIAAFGLTAIKLLSFQYIRFQHFISLTSALGLNVFNPTSINWPLQSSWYITIRASYTLKQNNESPTDLKKKSRFYAIIIGSSL